MELIAKSIKKDIMNMNRYYLTVRFSSGEIKDIEVENNTFIKEDYEQNNTIPKNKKG